MYSNLFQSRQLDRRRTSAPALLFPIYEEDEPDHSASDDKMTSMSVHDEKSLPKATQIKGYKKPRFIDGESHATKVLESRQGFFFTAMYLVISVFYISYQLLCYRDVELFEADKLLLQQVFSGFDVVVYLWLFYHTVCFLIAYPLVTTCFRCRVFTQVISWTISTSLLIMTIYATQFSHPDIGGVNKFILACESVRIAMKIIAFSSEFVWMKNYSEEKDEDMTNNNSTSEEDKNNNSKALQEPPITSYRQVLFYLFAPTLIYSPKYPTRDSRNYWRILRLSFLILTWIVFGFEVFKQGFLPLQVIGKQSISESMFYRQLYLFVGVYGYFLAIAAGFAWLHSWHNIWAEILAFGDRGQFYEDFYGSCEVKVFFAKWNNLIQNWFFRYIYAVVNQVYGKKAAAVSVLIVSGVLHDYFSAVVSGIVIPFYMFWIPLVLLGFGDFVNKLFLNRQEDGVMNYFCVSIIHASQGLIHFVLCLEYFARKNCPVQQDMSWFKDMTTFRFPSCLVIEE